MEIKQIAQYDTDGLAPTLGGMGGGGIEPWILIEL